jgi:hypothetical protein
MPFYVMDLVLLTKFSSLCQGITLSLLLKILINATMVILNSCCFAMIMFNVWAFGSPKPIGSVLRAIVNFGVEETLTDRLIEKLLTEQFGASEIRFGAQL